MTGKPTWRKLRELDRGVLSDLFLLLLYMLVGTPAPFLIAWAVKALRTASFPYAEQFALGGEFSLYSAAFIASAAYLLAHDRQKTKFPGRLGLFLLCGLLMGGAILGYVLVAPDVLGGGRVLLADDMVYAHVTISLFFASVIFYFVISVLDATRPETDIRKIDDHQIDNLTRQVSDLPG